MLTIQQKTKLEELNLQIKAKYNKEKNLNRIPIKMKMGEYLGTLFRESNTDRFLGKLSNTFFIGKMNSSTSYPRSLALWVESSNIDDNFEIIGGLDRKTYNWLGEIHNIGIIGISTTERGRVIQIDVFKS